VNRTERDPPWFGWIVKGLEWLTIALVLVSGSLLLAGLTLLLAPEPSRATETFRIIALFLGGFGLVLGSFVTMFASDRLYRGLDRDRSTWSIMLAGAGLLLLGLTVLQEIRIDLRVSHALLGVTSIVLLVGSLGFVGRIFGVTGRTFGFTTTVRGRHLISITLVSLGCGVALSFLPLFLAHATPRECAIRIGGIAALSMAVPALVAIGPLRRFRRELLASADGADWCPACGYRRPPHTRCPECGRGDGTFPTS
jgi:hypothetical protein